MSKLGYIIKNYLKLIFRNKVMLAVIIVSTVLVVAALSNAFHTLLDSAEEVNEFTLGYYMEEDSSYAMLEESLVDAFKEQNVTVSKFMKADPEKVVEGGEADVFVTFTGDSYHIYGDGKKEIQARVIEYVLYAVKAEIEALPAGGLSRIEITSEKLPTVEVSEAENYYGIIENVYFIGMAAILLCMIFQAERKSCIVTRFRVSNASCTERYFGKLISCAIVSFIVQSVICVSLVSLLFEVKIGVPLLSYGILALETIAFSAFGLILFLLFDNMAVSIGFLFMILWTMGFIGGTFETYMYSVVPENIRVLSPIYHVNRSLVELSVNGKSDYVMSCVMVLLAMIAVCIPLGIFITSKKKGV